VNGSAAGEQPGFEERRAANDRLALAGPGDSVGGLRTATVHAEATIDVDYRLSPGSPAIDAGDPAVADQDRDGSRNDMGAFGGPLAPIEGADAGDTTAPLLAAVAATSRVFSATISWTTDERSSSRVLFGPDVNYGRDATGPSNTLTHQVELAGLYPNTTYHFSVVSSDAFLNTVRSDDFTFTTPEFDGGPGVLPVADIMVPDDYATIQQALDAAQSGASVGVRAGFYLGRIDLKEGVSLLGSGAESTVLDGGGPETSGVVWGADGAVIDGFTIQNGERGVFAWSTSPTIRNCVITRTEQGIGTAAQAQIVGNVIVGNTDYGIFASSSHQSTGLSTAMLIANNVIVGNDDGLVLFQTGGVVVNNTIDGNSSGIGATAPLLQPLPLDIRNNVITNNAGTGMSQSDYGGGVIQTTAEYNDVWNNGTDYSSMDPGVGSISDDPLFVNRLGGVTPLAAVSGEAVGPANEEQQGGTHVEAQIASDQLALAGPGSRSAPIQAATLQSTSQETVLDFDYRLQLGSPVIDAGDPAGPYQDTDGSRNDMGAFGGPLSSTPGPQSPSADLFQLLVEGPNSNCGGPLPVGQLPDILVDCESFTMGFADEATDGLDAAFNEVEQPPRPPAGVFDARLLQVGGISKGQLVDVRQTPASALGEVVFSMSLQAGDGGLPLVFTWDPSTLPVGNWTLRDAAGGSFFARIDMNTNSSFEITDSAVSSVAVVFQAENSGECTYDLPAGWYMISLCGEPIVPIATVEDLCSGAVSLFGFSGAYVQDPPLEPGDGFWINMASARQCTVAVTPSVTTTLDLPAGWSLVGGPDSDVDVSSLQTTSTEVISVFGFAGGYFQATTMQSARAYWINMANAGQIVLTPSVAARRVPAATEAFHGPRMWLQSGDRRQLLQLGTVRSAIVELPPQPVEGVLDARVMIGGLGTWQVPESETSQEYALSVQGKELILGWDIPVAAAGRYELDLADRTLSLSGEGSVDLGTMVSPTNLRLRDRGSLPQAYRLEANIPNPFNPSTTIRYHLLEGGPTTLRIYDITGQRIRDLVSAVKVSGDHQVVWDGRDDRRVPVSSGVYIYELRTADHRAVKRMLLMK
jgi:hypothetical protein